MAVAVLVTGRPGAGKTTLIQRVVAQLGPAGGFYTRELRENGDRVGFELITLESERAVLAHVGRRGGPRVGKYGVDLGVMERLGVPALRRAASRGEYVVVDEIGKMELLSPDFVTALRELIRGPYRIVGAIMAGPHPVADEIKQFPGVQLCTLTPGNRDQLVEEMLALLAWQS